MKYYKLIRRVPVVLYLCSLTKLIQHDEEWQQYILKVTGGWVVPIGYLGGEIKL